MKTDCYIIIGFNAAEDDMTSEIIVICYLKAVKEQLNKL